MDRLVVIISTALLAKAPAAVAATSSSDQPDLMRTRVVQTKYGQVQGRVHRLNHPNRHHNVYDANGGKNQRGDELPDLSLQSPIEIYQGIPYATPPVKNNRCAYFTYLLFMPYFAC